MDAMSSFRVLPLLAFFFFFLAASATPIAIRVGVILDVETPIGKEISTCVSMAVEDFYSIHGDFKTRISLSVKDGGGDAVGAASAALGLIEKEQVQAIVGPQRSIQAKFVMELGRIAQVPIVSFSVKSSSLSPIISPYFVRATMDDSLQAKAIAAIVKKFQWREVVPVVEDSDYGYGMPPLLIDELRAGGAAVPYRSMIPFNSSAAAVSSELEKLRKRRTRVFVVHASYELGSVIFEQARAAGMMGEGYVWMTTYSLTVLGGAAMEGVIGLKPYFRETKKTIEFKRTWPERFRAEHPGKAAAEPTAFGLWAYDAVWALALAAENLTVFPPGAAAGGGDGDFGGLRRSSVGSALLELISKVDFNGLTGKFRLVHGQLASSDMEIVNVKNGTLNRVGLWTPTAGITWNSAPGQDQPSIVWPGDRTAPPKGWEWPLTNQTLRIGVPVKPGFEEFIKVVVHPLTDHNEFSGFCIDVFRGVMDCLPYKVNYEFVAFDDGKGNMNGTYDELTKKVFFGEFDGAAGDVTIRHWRSMLVGFSLPFTDSGVTMAVAVRDGQSRSAWVFVKPLSGGLWLAAGCFVFFTGLVIWFLEHRVNDDFRGLPSQQAGAAFYFVFASVVFAHRDKVVSNWSRFVVVVWVFVVLILASSYQASLTSILTAQQLQPAATDLAELIKKKEKVGYLENSFVRQLLEELGVEKENMMPYRSPADYAEALDKGSANGGVGGIVDEIPYLKVFLAKYPRKYAIVGPTYKTNGFGFVFPKGSPLLPDVSRAVLNFTEGHRFKDLERDLYGNITLDESFKKPSTSLELSNFRGLFLITGTASGGAFLIFLIFFFYNNQLQVHSILKSENSLREKLLLLLKLFDEIEDAPRTREAEEGGGARAMAAGDGALGTSPSTLSSDMQSHPGICGISLDDEDNDGFAAASSLEGNETPGGDIVDKDLHLSRQSSISMD